jgi:hypothetical protein
MRLLGIPLPLSFQAQSVVVVSEGETKVGMFERDLGLSGDKEGLGFLF